MSTGAVAENYARTLLELAGREGAEVAYGDLLADVAHLYRGERDFRLFLETPRIPTEEKKRVLRETMGERVPGTFLRFLLVVVEKGRQRALPRIETAYGELLDQRRDRIRASVTLAVEPDAELEEEIVEYLSGALGKEVVPQFRRDEEILGGLVVRVGDRVMDASLRRRLRELRRRLAVGDGSLRRG